MAVFKARERPFSLEVRCVINRLRFFPSFYVLIKSGKNGGGFFRDLRASVILITFLIMKEKIGLANIGLSILERFTSASREHQQTLVARDRKSPGKIRKKNPDSGAALALMRRRRDSFVVVL